MIGATERIAPSRMAEMADLAIEENLLTPRFYTTNFEKAASLDLSSHDEELKVMLAEMQADYNRRHFVRDESFERSWEHISGRERKAFIDYLERSCVSEFSGFLLFKELSRELKQRSPVLAEIFQLMARDEARHAGFLNKALGDFGHSLNLGLLTKNRTYTFFPIEWVLYAVYLSEKIGYWRYILIHRHLETHPDRRFYPLFRYFEPWCQDENRHGDIFKVLIRSQTKLWRGWRGRLWSRFFLVLVFVTHSLTVRERTTFYEMLDLDAMKFDADVIRKTNETAARAFPSVLDTSNPAFFDRLHQCSNYHQQMEEIDRSTSPSSIKSLRKLPLQLGIFWQIVRLYFLPTVDAEACRQQVC